MTILTSLGELPLILTGCMSSQTIIIITFRWEFSLKCHPCLSPPPPPPIPPILSCRGLVLPCFSRFYMYWQFNTYPTIISGDRTKWFSIDPPLFWKIGRVIVQGWGKGGGGAFAHHQMSCSSFDSQSPIFSVRSSGSKTQRYGRPSWIGKARRPLPRFMWNRDNRPFRQASALSCRSYEEIVDCE